MREGINALLDQIVHSIQKGRAGHEIRPTETVLEVQFPAANFLRL